MTTTREQHPYYRETTFDAPLGNGTVRIVTKPGIGNWERISPATMLLAEAVQTTPGARILLFGCGHGALGVALARIAAQGSVLLVDANYTATTMAARTLTTNGITNATVAGDPAAIEPGTFDVAVLEAPSGRKFARRWLVAAHAALKVGGHLYLAGPKAEGIESLIGDARKLFGQGATLTYRDHNRIGVATKQADATAPAWAAEAGIAPGTWHEFNTTLAGEPFQIASLPGIFSYDSLDDGTAFLLDQLRVRPGERVLDIGCGWGALGLAAARKGAGQVDLIDSSHTAIAAARRNIAAAGLTNARALPSDALSAVIGERYDLIVTNPPFHAGKMVNYDAAGAFIAGARELLTSRGRLLLVANAFIRYERAMQERYGTVEIVAEDRRYHVLQGLIREKRESVDVSENDERTITLDD
ncbi:MAG TPA: methyltransferase [Thermomicrobiales bacterium]|jgi:16S rRNA (guanine1207-N2)-methyltransferase